MKGQANFIKKGIILPAFLFIVGFSSCQKLDLQTSNPDRVVVKGYLFAGHSVSINIIKQLIYGSTDSTTHPVENIDVTISDSHGAIFPLVYQGKGVYASEKLIVAAGETYTLTFTYNGKEISATTTVPSKPQNFYGTSLIKVLPIGSESGPPSHSKAEYSWSNPNNGYFLLVVENTEAKPTPINDTTKYEAFPAFRQSPTQGSTISLMGRSFYYYGNHNVILYAINKEYVDLYEDTGNTSQNITNPPGNIKNGFGVFTAINSDTLKLEVTN